MIFHKRKEKVLALNNISYAGRYPLEEPSFFILPKQEGVAVLPLAKQLPSLLSEESLPSHASSKQRAGRAGVFLPSLVLENLKLGKVKKQGPLSFSPSSHFFLASNPKNNIKESPFLELWKKTLARHSKSTQNYKKHQNRKDQIKSEVKVSNFKGAVDILQSTPLYTIGFSEDERESKSKGNHESWLNQGINRKKKNLFFQKKEIKTPAVLPLLRMGRRIPSCYPPCPLLRMGGQGGQGEQGGQGGQFFEARECKHNQKKLKKNSYVNQKSYDFRIALKNRLIPTEYSLETFHRSNQDTCLLHNPAVFEGDWVQSGDLLADCAASSGGELSLGKNILIAYMPWEGYNFEDAILISERLVFEDVYSSIHIERYDVEIRETKYGMETITRNIPELHHKELEHLDSNGVAKLGSWIQEGDILVGRVTPINKKSQSTYKNLLFTILQTKPESVRDSSLRAPRGMNGKIVNVQRLKKTVTLDTLPLLLKQKNLKLQARKGSPAFLEKTNKKPKKSIKKKAPKIKKILKSEIELDKGVSSIEGLTDFVKNSNKGLSSQRIEEGQINIVYVYLAEKRRIQVGDKMAGRHGNKGIVSQILPKQDMPFLANGTPLDMVLNPLGVPSRMNVGQIYECLLGLAAKYLGEHYKIFPFDEKYGPEASRSFVYSKLYEARKKTGNEWLFNPNCPGKTRLFDGRTGDPFDQSVTVGYSYMLKLVHLVDDKIHMRSTGPYSLVTQQPLRGRSKQGGQRLGEMEVWALEGYGAAFTLLEMLTIKSDDMTGRMTLWSNLILNKDLSIGTPESFKVLVCELQALCLDIGIFRNDSKGNLSEIESLTELP